MTIELAIGIFFVLLTAIQAILLLKKMHFKNNLEENEFISFLMKFISNSSLYVAILLITASSFEGAGFTNASLEELPDLILGIPTAFVILLILLVTLIAIIIAYIKGSFTSKKNHSNNLINQQKAREIK